MRVAPFVDGSQKAPRQNKKRMTAARERPLGRVVDKTAYCPCLRKASSSPGWRARSIGYDALVASQARSKDSAWISARDLLGDSWICIEPDPLKIKDDPTVAFKFRHVLTRPSQTAP